MPRSAGLTPLIVTMVVLIGIVNVLFLHDRFWLRPAYNSGSPL